MSLLGKKIIKGEEYNYKSTTRSRDKALEYKKKHGWKNVAIDEVNSKKNGRYYNIFIKSKKEKKIDWKSDFEKAGKIFDNVRKNRLEIEKPVIVSEFERMKNGKKEVVGTHRRKLPKKKIKYKKL